MLVLIEHLLESKLLLVTFLLVFVLLVIVTVLFVHLIYMVIGRIKSRTGADWTKAELWIVSELLLDELVVVSLL